MLSNYLKIALRVLVRNKVFSLINVFGLALSMSICLLLIVLISDQLGYDGFHANKDRIYRVISDRAGSSPGAFATTPARLAEELAREAPQVESVLQLFTDIGSDVQHDQTVLRLQGIGATPNYFGFFDFALLDGDPAAVLSEPYSLVLAESSARALFGADSAVGQIVSLPELGDFTVTGVTADPPYNSHLDYDFLISYASLLLLERDGKVADFSQRWDYTDQNLTYIRLPAGADPDALQPWLDNQSRLNYPDPTEYALHFRMQPLTGIALGDWLENDATIAIPGFAVYFLSVLAVLVMLSAGFNYTNLCLARALSRAREVGVRKASGAVRWQVFAQFIGEALLLSTLAFGVALILLEVVLLPGFKTLQLVNRLGLEIGTSPGAYLACFVFSLAIGILAGGLPALYLSGLRPVRVLKGLSDLTVSGLALRKVLIVAQFMLSLIFMVSVVTIYLQLRFMVEADYGFVRENIVNINLQGNDYQLVMSELERLPGVQAVSASSLYPGLGSARETSVRKSIGDEPARSHLIQIEPGFIENFGLTLVAGSNFPQGVIPADERQIILNETAVKEYGFGTPADAIGQTLVIDTDRVVEVIGVVRDFHYRDLRSPIGPFMFRFLPDRLRYLNMRVQEGAMDEALAGLQATWKQIDPQHVLDYRLFEQQIGETYALYSDLLKVVGVLSVLILTISTLGVLGISALSAEYRMKELGIRKVMGATDWNVLLLLARTFMMLLGVAVVLAVPIAWTVSNTILQSFAYRIDSPLVGVILGTLLVLGFGGIAVGSQAVRAAQVRPVLALRYE
jgi:putative ABC transport system permease protein